MYDYYTWLRIDFDTLPKGIQTRWKNNRSSFSCNINYSTIEGDGSLRWKSKNDISFDELGRSECIWVKSRYSSWESAKNEIGAAWNVKLDGCEIWDSKVEQMFRGSTKNQYNLARINSKRVTSGCTMLVKDSVNTVEQNISNEVKITVIIELPHSRETGVGAKGLAGHTAMAVGERYFDYGPDYSNKKTFNESQYDADLNEDGDKSDILTAREIPDLGYTFAPGRPWWGEMISKNPSSVTLSQAINFIMQDWRKTNIYGEVYKAEFFVNLYEANKMIEWWEHRYQHLKIYSVKPWVGEQCTTAVKHALIRGKVVVDLATQTPEGMLSDLRNHVRSTSDKHQHEQPVITVLKREAIDWEP